MHSMLSKSPDKSPDKASEKLPKHVAIIMDGNGRWASRRRLPRFAGHKSGVEAVRNAVRVCREKNIGMLTLFAFSSENWRRPAEEVGMLMGLFMTALDQEVKKLHDNNIRLRIVGDRSAFNRALQDRIADAEALTVDNDGLSLVVAANYGGRWDITQATRKLAEQVQQGKLEPGDITEALLESHMCLSDSPEPDLFIRTGGEKRVSNFLLWQLAYTEFYFTDTLWPDFDRSAFEGALASYAGRERRFGRTSEQVVKAESS
jgi:undecaprenyl diphosphate synthase